MILLFAAGTLIAQSRFEKFISYLNGLSSDSLKQSAVDSFWVSAKKAGIPFITGDTANFIYRGNASTVSVPGDHNGWDISTTKMAKVNGTNLFYYSRKFEMNARIDYKFVLNGSNWILDPSNSHIIWGGFGPNSELAMPGYKQPWEIKYYSTVPHGTKSVFYLHSSNTNRNYRITVYLSPNYNANDSLKYPTVYFQDGSEYIQLASAINVIDNLIDSSKIQPVIAVFVKPTNRNDEYAFGLRNAYVNFFVNELVPRIDSSYRTIQDAADRLVLGDSFGGNISGLISFKHPEIFGNCGLQSAAFFPNNFEVFNLFKDNSPKQIKIFSVWGSYESLKNNMYDFKDVLTTKDYEFKWAEFPEGHSWGLWRATIDLILEFIFPNKTTPVERTGYAKPKGFELYQNYPNPFGKIVSSNAPFTVIKYHLPKKIHFARVSLKVYDILGREITTLVDKNQKPGNYKIEFSAKNLASGIYFYRMALWEGGSIFSYTSTRKMMVLN
jgi:enterochelin esterase-like enzyme